MSVETARKITDEITFFKATTEASSAMLTTMYRALAEIAACEISLDGGIATKEIAQDALIEINNIGKKFREQTAQN